MLQVLTIRQSPHLGADLIREARVARRSQGNLLVRMMAGLDGARPRSAQGDAAVEIDVVVRIARSH